MALDGREVARGMWGEAEAQRAPQGGSRNRTTILVVSDRQNKVLAPGGSKPFWVVWAAGQPN